MRGYQGRNSNDSNKPRIIVIRLRLRLRLTRGFGGRSRLPHTFTIPLQLVLQLPVARELSPHARLIRTAMSPRLPQAWLN